MRQKLNLIISLPFICAPFLLLACADANEDAAMPGDSAGATSAGSAAGGTTAAGGLTTAAGASADTASESGGTPGASAASGAAGQVAPGSAGAALAGFGGTESVAEGGRSNLDEDNVNAAGSGGTSSQGGATSDVVAGGPAGPVGGSAEGGQGPSDEQAGAAAADETAGGTGSPEEEPTGMTNPSPGCGKGGRPDGGQIYQAEESWLLFPASYDGNTPYPVLFGFHGCGGGNRGDSSRTEYTDLTNGTVFEEEYVRAVPVSQDSGGCWNYNTDITRAKSLFDNLVNNYCVDLNKVYATGHSSGAQFVVQILTGNHAEDAAHFDFKGVAPVAASDYGAVTTPTAFMYIQGQNDTVRGGDGKDTVDRFVDGNSCSTDSTPFEVEGCQSGGTSVDPGCVSYRDCGVPTVWCSHNDPAYSDTSHGVPCFTAYATDSFFKSLN